MSGPRCRLRFSQVVAFGAGSAFAVEPTGLWYDHTGRGAVEITKCGGQLCGRLVWLKDAQHAKQVCGIQIIGDVKPMANGAWDNGWIYDPEQDAKFSVELTPMGAARRSRSSATWARSGSARP